MNRLGFGFEETRAMFTQ